MRKFNISDLPMCARKANFKTFRFVGTVFRENRENITTLSIGDFATLWIPPGRYKNDFDDLVIYSHGSISYKPVTKKDKCKYLFKSAPPGYPDYYAKQFVVPDDITLNFFVKEGAQLASKELDFIEKRVLAIPREIKKSGELCFDYSLSKAQPRSYRPDKKPDVESIDIINWYREKNDIFNEKCNRSKNI